MFETWQVVLRRGCCTNCRGFEGSRKSIFNSIFLVAFGAYIVVTLGYIIGLLGRLTSANERMVEQLDHIAHALAALARKDGP